MSQSDVYIQVKLKQVKAEKVDDTKTAHLHRQHITNYGRESLPDFAVFNLL